MSCFLFIFLLCHISGQFCKMGTMAWKIWILLSLEQVSKNWRATQRVGCFSPCIERMLAISSTGMKTQPFYHWLAFKYLTRKKEREFIIYVYIYIYWNNILTYLTTTPFLICIIDITNNKLNYSLQFHSQNQESNQYIFFLSVLLGKIL